MRRRDPHRIGGATTLEPAPRDVEALERVVEALDGDVTDEIDAHTRILRSLIVSLDLDYGAAWLPDADGRLRVRVTAGDMASTMAGAWDPATPISEGAGYGGQALKSRATVILDVTSGATKCPRWAAALAAGARHGCFVPVIEGNRVTAVLEYYSRRELPFFGGRTEKWLTIGRLVAHARRSALATARLTESLDDRHAVTTVVTKVGEATNEDAALRVALESVRTAFGWAYGSFWALDPEQNLLRFSVESGSAGDEFRNVTLAASFAEGVGVSGRAWRTRDLVYVRDLAEVTDCVRAPAAQRAGVKSGVCFPILSDGRVVGTMDFFATETIELSESRISALRNVQQLVSQRLDILRREANDAANSRALLETVSRLREAADEAGRVAERAVGQASSMTTEVAELGSASAAVGDVIRIISGIADQTNLLALNATIEAARAGELGRGFAVVASEVKDLARETAAATKRVSDQIAGMQASSESVASGIHATSEVIGRLDAVQAQIGEILEEQVQMAKAFDTAR